MSTIKTRRVLSVALGGAFAVTGCWSSHDLGSTSEGIGGFGGFGGSLTTSSSGSGSSSTEDGGSRCSATATTVTCSSESLTLSDGVGVRTVTYQTPLGAAPAGGFPAVVFFQGSLVPGHTSFSAVSTDPFGMFELTLTVKALLDRGFAVIAPDAQGDGTTFWETNIPPYSTDWTGSPDDVLMQNLFKALASGSFGSINGAKLDAMGISSGGFMTSRMAVSYPGRFRALADASGSYATCSDVCAVPTPLPSNHPPTLFLHGDLDAVVPSTAVTPYLDALQAEGHVAKLVTDAAAGHQWLSEAVTAVPAWFEANP